MIAFRPLPWEYAVRNLLRRPLRTGLTLAGLATVVVLVFVAVGFIRGLERSLARSGDPGVAVVFSLGMGKNLEYSSVPARTADLLAASLDGIRSRYGRPYVSPELYQGTEVTLAGASEPSLGLVRGVTPAALLVRRAVEIVEGRWPEPGEVLVGRLAGAKLGAADGQLDVGETVTLEGRPWRISGRFAAGGTAFDSELWCRLDDLQGAMRRQDLSLVALTPEPGAEFAQVDLFCKSRKDLELQAMRESEYYATLLADYRPVRVLAWLVVALVSAAGVFAGLNTMHGAVLGRVPELATLQTIGFHRRAIVLSLIQEGALLAMTASLTAAVVAVLAVDGATMRMTMGAFRLVVDGTTVLVGCGTGLGLGVVGSLPPAIRALRTPVVEAFRAV